MTETYITSTASHFDQPIADLAVKLVRREPGPVDLDYVYAAILLTVARFEAFMARAAYHEEIKPVQVTSPASFEGAVDQQPRKGREISLPKSSTQIWRRRRDAHELRQR
jgi:hypothetical protein